MELGVLIGKKAKDITEAVALNHVQGYCLALDLTARNLQDIAKRNGNPWTVAKGFDTFTPLSQFISVHSVKDPHDLRLQLFVDDQLKQDGNTKDMIFRIPKLISTISRIMTLEPGDLILTGTPAGVGPIYPLQELKGKLLQDEKVLAEFKFKCAERK